jgi:ubiquinone/menaquinone biosynthesis C-methylase UbiE
VGADGVYGRLSDIPHDQLDEVSLRERVAAIHYDDYLNAISRSHSIAVMDREVDLFLAKIPRGGMILDIGGCWGWHWRRLAAARPDVGIVIIDFVRANLHHARNILGALVGDQVVLMHADATALPFTLDSNFQGFDGIWTVQTFQHIPKYGRAVEEAYRVLKLGGVFSNYSLNVQAYIRGFKRMLGRSYLIEGWVEGSFWLARASLKQKQQIEAIFGNEVTERWSEIIYSPELRFIGSGKNGSWFGKLDALLSNNFGFCRWLARQHSFHCKKNNVFKESIISSSLSAT